MFGDPTITQEQFDGAMKFLEQRTATADKIYLLVLELAGYSPKPADTGIPDYIQEMLEAVFSDGIDEAKRIHDEFTDKAYRDGQDANRIGSV